jgi:hypothetical protein
MFAGVVASDLAAASNLADVGGHGWLFLLPTMEPARVLCIGEIPDEALGALRRGAGEVIQVARGALAALPAHGVVDLLVIDALTLGGLGRRSGAVAWLRRSLKTDATMVVLGKGATGRRTRRITDAAMGAEDEGRTAVLDVTGRAARGLAATGVLIVPTSRPRASMPRVIRRARTMAGLARARVSRIRRPGQAPGVVRGHPSDPRPRRPVVRGQRTRGASLIRTRGHDLLGPPAWLQSVACEKGISTDAQERWAFAPPRGYRSQKVLFLLGRAQGPPELIAKLTQEPRFNARLDNEIAALRRLESEGLVDPGTVPQVVGTARCAGLSVALETAWDGASFRDLSTAEPDCPFAARALDWFTSLAERSAAPDPLGVQERWAEIDDLIERYVTAFRPDPEQVQTLRDHGTVVLSEHPPTVFFHGDPGNWNLRARPDGTIGVFDWENAHHAGPPVWDVALFLATFGAFVAEAEGRRYTAATFAQQFRPGSSLRPLIDRTMREYGRRVGVRPPAMGSLMVLCWVHQALKGVSRAPVGAGASGLYHHIVNRVLEEPSLADFA